MTAFCARLPIRDKRSRHFGTSIRTSMDTHASRPTPRPHAADPRHRARSASCSPRRRSSRRCGDLQRELGSVGHRHRLDGHRLPARSPRSRRRSSAASATCSARSACSRRRSRCSRSARSSAALSDSLEPADRRPRAAGPRRRRLPAVLRDHPRRVPARAGARPASAMLGAIAAIGGGVGLPLGGVLVDGPGYHWIFWLGAVMGVLATIADRCSSSRSRRSGRRAASTCPARASSPPASALRCRDLARRTTGAGAAPRTLGLIAAGLVVLAGWVVLRAAHAAAARSNMRRSPRPPVLTTNISTLLIGFGMFGTFVLVPQLAQLPKGGDVGFGLSATEAGLLLAPGRARLLARRAARRPVGERYGSKLAAPRRRAPDRRRAARAGLRPRLRGARSSSGPA